MTQVRRTISISHELDVNLDFMAGDRQVSLSALVEMLLREHSLVDKQIQLSRLEDSLEDFGVVPSKTGPLRHIREAGPAPHAASDGASPKPRRKTAARP